MKKSTSLSLIVLAVLGVLGYNGYRALAQSQSQDTMGASTGLVSANVNIAELTQAGYTSVQVEPPANGRFAAPTQYFRVHETGDPAQETSNLVMVSRYQSPSITATTTAALFAFGTNIHSLTIAGATAQESTVYDGRLFIDFVKNGNYVSLFGPDQAKAEALAQAVAGSL